LSDVAVRRPADVTTVPIRRSGDVGDRVFAALTTSAGVFVLVLLTGLILSLLLGAWPAFRHYGVGFLTSADWDPGHTDSAGNADPIYGAAGPIFGTIVTSIIALVMAVPLAFGIAFFLTELAPNWLRRPIGTAVELLAAVPSIVYGMWGVSVIRPLMANYVQPHVIDTFAGVPVLQNLFAGPPFGFGIMTAGLILGVMVLPFIAATMRDVFLTVPGVFKESAYSFGCTMWEVMWRIVVPYTRASVIGGIMLGLGRALGETLAVTFVIGTRDGISANLFAPGSTIASKIALNYGNSDGITLSALLALGFLLFVISFIVLAISRTLLRPGAHA